MISCNSLIYPVNIFPDDILKIALKVGHRDKLALDRSKLSGRIGILCGRGNLLFIPVFIDFPFK